MSKKKIALLVDDSKSARFFLRNLLQRNGVKVEMAESGEAALEFLKANQPDIIFMDHLMPGIDGFETTRAIKKNPATQAIPVIMCTSNEGEEYARQAGDKGASDILPKPPTEEKLHSILAELDSKPPVAMETPPPAAPAMATEAIRELARTAAEDAIQTRLEPLLAERLEELRQTLRQEAEAHSGALVSLAIDQQTTELREQWLASTRQESEAVATAAAEKAAVALLENRAEEIRASTDQQTAESIQGFRDDWAAQREALLSETGAMAAQTTRSEVERVQDARRDTTGKVAAETAERVARETADRLLREHKAASGSSQTQAKLYAAGAALVGVLAALVGYLLT